MEGQEGQVIQSTALALPDEAQFRRDITAINRFQQVVHSCMVKDLDYGIIPGTQRPTLLKPGAEKIAKLLGLSDQYEIIDQKEDWQTPFFRYLVKCKLVHIGMGATVSEGMGECNSMESKYRWRWVGERDLPAGTDKTKLVSQERRSAKTGGHWTVYRMDNDDIYSQVNTILKMAKKRALVDAALSAGRLSDVFTQDLEDLPNLTRQEFTAEKPAERARKEPSKQIDKRGEFEKEGRDVLKETLDKPTKKQSEPSPDEPQQVLHPKTEQEAIIDMDWLKESLEQLQWASVGKWLTDHYKVTGKNVSEMVKQLNPDQQREFAQEVEERLSMS